MNSESETVLTLPNGHRVSLSGFYQGRQAFLMCSGPSLFTHDLTKLNQRGVLTMAVNNTAAVYRPHLWTCVDDPGNFCDAIWRDPGILKFVPTEHFAKPVLTRNAADQLTASWDVVGQMPAIFAYDRNEEFVAERWLTENSFNWGNHASVTDTYGNRGSRSVLLVALKLLYYLGVRTVYLIGSDFRMVHGARNYAFEQDRSVASVNGNNKTYRVLNTRLGALRPYFDRAGFRVYNCTPDSGLTAFPYLAYEAAISCAEAEFPRRIVTAGMYDRTSFVSPATDSAIGVEPSAVTAHAGAAVGVSKSSENTRQFSLEIVSHCWRYSGLLTYQLSSLVLYPPANVNVLMTVFFAESDEETVRVRKFFDQQPVKNVQWRWWPLAEELLWRRAIGRNMAALSTTADRIWFCDCDQVFHQGFLDKLAAECAERADVLLYPQRVNFSRVASPEDPVGERSNRCLTLKEIHTCDFYPRYFNRAVGGLQIAVGEVARMVGYCKDIPRFMRPVSRWMRTFEDVHFRKTLKTNGVPLPVDGLYRIEHMTKGRDSRDVSL